MNRELPVVLLAFTLGCSRSGLDVLGGEPLVSGDDATGGPGDDAAPSESGAVSMIESGAGDAPWCNYNDPTRRYVGRGGCATIDWSCTTGVSFQNSCGCVLSDGGAISSSGGSASVSPSCAHGGPGMTNCGPGGNENCCTSLEVTGGTFFRTYVNDGGGPTGEADPATVSAFRLDKYAVTVGRFRQFAAAWSAGYRPPPGSGKHTYLNGGQGLGNAGGPVGVPYEPGWVTSGNSNVAPTNANLTDPNYCLPYGTWTPTAGSNEKLPVNCVNWYEAYAFCIWGGGFLPSEAEWEYAAAGGDQQREYPWGSTDPGTGNQYAIYDCLYPSGSAKCTGVANVAPVGTAVKGAGRWGQLDMAGNVGEWILDWYAPYVNPWADCATTVVASCTANCGSRGDKGGIYLSTLSSPANHWPGGAPEWRGYWLGFRCARNP